MPVALLIGILVASVLINVALIVVIARADDFALRAPRFARPLIEVLRSDTLDLDAAVPRRRPLYVADTQRRPIVSSPPVQVVPSPGIGRGDPPPLTETLPADLAELLSRPAEIAMPPDAPPHLLARAPRSASPPSASGDGLERDALTGLEGPASWSRILEIENARLLRYRRPVTVVMADVEGLQRLSDRLGQEPVQRLLPVVADALVREARSSDWVARIGEARFAALLPETDEIQAINYVERVRAMCEPWLSSSAVQLRLAIGWSSPSASSDLEFAIRRAEERMHADRRTPGRGIQPTRVVPAAFVTLASRAGGADGRGTVEGSAVSPADAAPGAEAEVPAAGEATTEETTTAGPAAAPPRSRGRRKRGAAAREG